MDDLGLWNRSLCSEKFSLTIRQQPITYGCTDNIACNYDVDALIDDEACFCSMHVANTVVTAHQDAVIPTLATSILSLHDDGSCDHGCCPGPGCCDQGLAVGIESMPRFEPTDINLDGCVQLNDLLDLLSAYGDCGAEESMWQ